MNKLASRRVNSAACPPVAGSCPPNRGTPPVRTGGIGPATDAHVLDRGGHGVQSPADRLWPNGNG